ncbi:hypothetical protein SDC9_74721 [bioreactor metagenome]|uniref:Uncharacterized protein n=1 Tax=bioreactor metagenome TaxID=1076179 RepID=A0A644YHV5_9ZZZZ
MKINGYFHIVFQSTDNFAGTDMVNKPGHIFQGDHIGSHGFDFFGLANKIIDSENRWFRSFFDQPEKFLF